MQSGSESDGDPAGTGTTGTMPMTTAAPASTSTGESMGADSTSASESTGPVDSTGEPHTDSSESGGEPCGGACADDTPMCDAKTGVCVQCLADGDCDDNYECSADSCDATGTCIAPYSDTKDCQAGWTQLAPAASPSARFWPAMAYDATREEVVLFGGLAGTTMSAETWTWDGSNWTAQTPATSPSPRWTAGITYDRARERVVMFGGTETQFANVALDETWEWDGQTWEQIETAQSPSPRAIHGNMTYDAEREVVVVFGGGISPSQPVLGDVWEYDGTTWTEVDLGSGPTERIATCFEYTGTDLGSVLFGGGDWDPYYGDTWNWDGTAWSELSPAAAPSDRQSQVCAYDSFRERLVLFGGGLNPAPLENDTWEFDGVDWTEAQLSTSPAETCCGGFAYDEARREIVLVDAGQTWRYGP